jgi:hypothetical protein
MRFTSDQTDCNISRGSRFLKLFRNLSLILIVNFNGNPAMVKNPPYHELEKTIRQKYDSRAVFTWEQYSEFLAELKKPRYRVMPLHQMNETYDTSTIIIGLRHDVDFNPFKALEMARMEHDAGIRATYFLLATADYSGSFTGSRYDRSKGLRALYNDLSDTGAEIGIHNDLIAIMILYGIDPYKFNQSELDFYKSLKIPIYGTAAHGSEIAKKTVPNFQIFSDFAARDSISYQGKKYPLGKRSLKQCGYQYEAYFIKHNIYLTDSGGKWHDQDGFKGALQILRQSVPGDRIEILVHPEWWGKTEQKPKAE